MGLCLREFLVSASRDTKVQPPFREGRRLRDHLEEHFSGGLVVAHAGIDNAEVIQRLHVVRVGRRRLLKAIARLNQLAGLEVNRAEQEESLGVRLDLDRPVQDGLRRRVIVLAAIGTRQQLHRRGGGLGSLENSSRGLHGLRVQSIRELRLGERDEQSEVIGVLHRERLKGIDQLAGALKLGLKSNEQQVRRRELRVRVEGAPHLQDRVLVRSLSCAHSSERVVASGESILGRLRQRGLRFGARQLAAVDEMIGFPGMTLARREIRRRFGWRSRGRLRRRWSLGLSRVVCGLLSGPSVLRLLLGGGTGSRALLLLGFSVIGALVFRLCSALVSRLLRFFLRVVLFPVILVLDLLGLLGRGLRPDGRHGIRGEEEGDQKRREPGWSQTHQRPSGTRVSIVYRGAETVLRFSSLKSGYSVGLYLLIFWSA